MEELGLVIYKIVQICNLNCSYCYVYNKGDESWRERPKIAALETSAALGRAILEYCGAHGKSRFSVELHGGEPTLLGPRRFLQHVRALRASAAPVELDIFMQTNGTLLDEKWMRALEAAGVTFSISLDGPPEYADEKRIYRSGKGSTQNVLNRINFLRSLDGRFDQLCHGALCVISPGADGSKYVDWFADLRFRGIDFLLPDGNFKTPPLNEFEANDVLRFMVSAFDRWLELDKNAPSIRLFEYAIEAKLGRVGSLDAFGGDISTMRVVESNGALGCHDVMRMCGRAFSKDQEFIFNGGLLQQGDFNEKYGLSKIQELHKDCLECVHVKSCGGGYLPHRYDGESFGNRSWYCSVLYSFFSHVEKQLLQRVPPAVWRVAPVISYQST